MRDHRLAALACACCFSFSLLLAGCGGDGNMAPADLSMPGPPDLAPPDDLNVPLREPEILPVTPHKGRVLAAPELVTITFAGYSLRTQVEGLGDYMMTSPWLDIVGADYGVGRGKHLAKVQLPEAAPAGATTEAQAIAMIKRYAAMGTLPAPPAKTLSQMVYMLYYPAKTDFDSDGKLCDDYEGYHGVITFADGGRATFAIIGDCELGIDDMTNTASHELIEAATDPWLDSWMADAPLPDPWALEDGMENADLCWYSPSHVAGGFALARVWSPSAAMARKEPCLPAPPTATAFETVVVTPAAPQVGKPGERVSWVITGWSTNPAMAPWDITTGTADMSDFYASDLKPELAVSKISHGVSARVTITVPADAGPGSLGGLLITSGPERHMAPLAFTTP